MIPKLMRHLKGEDQEQIGQEQKQKQKMKIKKKVMMTTNNQKRKKFEEEEDEKRRRSQSHSSTTCTTTMNNDDDVTGLRIVTQIITNSSSSSSHIIKPNHNVVIKSALLTKPNTIYCSNYNNNNTRSSLELCFLKACTLCNKNLSHDKDIYMYRGDQGFCSIECRNRQIVMDEMKELEEGYYHNYKQMISSSTSYRNKCWNDARLETRLILEELRLHRLQSNKPIPNNEYSPHHQNHWTINVS